MTSSSSGQIRFGIKEWIGLAALALSPAMGFATWGIAIHSRVAVLERMHEERSTQLFDIAKRLDPIPRIEERQAALAERMMRVEQQVERASRGASRGSPM